MNIMQNSDFQFCIYEAMIEIRMAECEGHYNSSSSKVRTQKLNGICLFVCLLCAVYFTVAPSKRIPPCDSNCKELYASHFLDIHVPLHSLAGVAREVLGHALHHQVHVC